MWHFNLNAAVKVPQYDKYNIFSPSVFWIELLSFWHIYTNQLASRSCWLRGSHESRRRPPARTRMRIPSRGRLGYSPALMQWAAVIIWVAFFTTPPHIPGRGRPGRNIDRWTCHGNCYESANVRNVRSRKSEIAFRWHLIINCSPNSTRYDLKYL